ncbi:MAG TPA: hypothetical protein VL201_00895, partial [Patescibacteria group bacterium]|nr:hypothetical protein [Patescibacteria group bacterium]
GANKFKTIEYKADGISDNRNSLLQLKDWFASKVGTIEYDNAIDTTSGLLDGQVKVLEKMLNGINITYPGTTNTTDKLVIVTADQLNNVFKTIDAAIDDLDKIKTADGKAATEIDAIKKQIENVKNKRISYLQDIILKIANDSAETQALGMYLKVKRLDYWTVKSMLHQSLADYEKLTPLDEGVNGSLLNVAKKQQMLGDHMPHYKMLEQESSYFVDTIDVLSGIATTFKEYFEKHNALFNRSKIENALVTNLFSKTHKKLLDQAETYLSMLGSVDNKLGPQALNNKDTGIDNLTNREFYNKHLVGPLKSIALAMKKWTSIENNLLSIFFITIDGLNDIVKEANSSVSSFFANK